MDIYVAIRRMVGEEFERNATLYQLYYDIEPNDYNASKFVYLCSCGDDLNEVVIYIHRDSVSDRSFFNYKIDRYCHPNQLKKFFHKIVEGMRSSVESSLSLNAACSIDNDLLSSWGIDMGLAEERKFPEICEICKNRIEYPVCRRRHRKEFKLSKEWR
jgi:hypothetical protein